jgi:exodeoxyribonuclease VII large subunit
MYFSLKDEFSQIKSVLFKNASARLKFSLKDGMKIVCLGRVSVYEKEGQYQLYVNEIVPKGQGALQLAFEQLKERLLKEGLFDESRKRSLPFLPDSIGVVTSPTGAVIRDILHVLDRRFPATHLIINPVRVQGEGAGEEIVRAIQEFNSLKNVRVIILARGGGSLEDLWAFNEEVVARAIYNSRIPILSAVGHETDFTIADFVADRRAPTPSAAAEIIVPGRVELDEKIDNYVRHLWRSLTDIVPQYSQRVDVLLEQLSRAVAQLFKTAEVRLEGLSNQLEALSPLAILKRGYSITSFHKTGRVLCSTKEVNKGDKVKTRLSDGEFISEAL